MTTRLSSAQVDRAAGVLLGMACGDALGAPFEFGPPLGLDVAITMTGGGGFSWEAGEWTDDTSMAIAIAEVTEKSGDLRADEARDRVAARWAGWGATAKDVGNQTKSVLSAATRAARTSGETEPTAADVALASAEHDARKGRSGGNGSLMRTAPVALAYLHDPDALSRVAQEISAMTHHDPEAGEACTLWCLAIRHAVLHGTLDVRSGLVHLSEERARVWAARLDEAEAGQPSDFEKNGWVVEALQGAWSAIMTTAGATGPAHFRLALEAAVRGGRDTDTVAAIAGSLLGGLYGASAVPALWRRELHGWPGLRARDLVRLAVMTARGGESSSASWPAVATLDYSKYRGSGALAQHPDDDHVWIGGVDALVKLPAGVDAVVSLCRLGSTQVPAQGVAPRDHVEVWLLDESEPDKNPNLDFVLTDAVAAVEALRADGRTVLLHCVQAQSRTPAVAALYGARLTARTPTEALADIVEVLPNASPNRGFRAALDRL